MSARDRDLQASWQILNRVALFLAALLLARVAHAATFLVPSDRTLVTASKAIVIATAGESQGRWAPGGWIETVTELHVDDAIKGPVVAGETIQVTELGGVVGAVGYAVAGSPTYMPGERALLFLETNDRGEWVSKNMAVGKFTPASDRYGRPLLLRDAGEVAGWNADGTPHREPQRLSNEFLSFVRATVRGEEAKAGYVVSDPQPRAMSTRVQATALAPAPSTYLLQGVGGLGLRWPSFPAPVVFFSHGTQPGALGGGITSLQRAFAAWTNDAGSNIVYTNGGTTAVARTGFNAGSPDGLNTVQFNDPGNEIPGSFNGTNGDTLAIGGAWYGTAVHSAHGEQYYTIVEADLVVQDGIFGAGLTGNGFDHVLTHELGHTLGLRHSDQPPAGGTSSSTAIMDSGVDFNRDTTGAVLQAWDVEAIDAVYGSGVITPPACNPPKINAQPAPTIDVGSAAVTFSLTASGDAPLHYQWYVGLRGNTNVPIPSANSSALTVKPAVTTGYWVRVTNGCDPPADSITAYAIVNSCPPVTITAQSGDAAVLQGRSVTLSATAGGGTISYQWYAGSSGVTSSPISGATGPSITVQPTASTTYWVRASNSCGSSADSDTYAVTVIPCTAPKIVVQPSGGEVVTGYGATLFAAVTGTLPITYQWYEGTFPDVSHPANNGSSATLAIPGLVAPASYWLHVSGECGAADSTTARIAIVSACTPPTIVAQPQDQSVTAGSTAIASVTVSGPSLSYQWYQGPLFDFTHPLGGNAPAVLTGPITAATAFWVRVTSPCGSVNSTVATFSPALRRRAAKR